MPGAGTSTQSSTEQSQTSYPQWTQNAQQNTYSTGSSMLENFLRNPQYAVAGQNTDQMKAFDLARDTARTAYGTGAGTAPGSPNLTASTVGRDQILAGMNPFLDTVGNTTLDNMRREYLNADSGIATKYAGAGGMGGSGEAIARGQAARGYNQNVASTIAQLQSAGYDKATALALANAQAENSMKSTAADYGLKGAQVNDSLRTSQQAREMSAMQQMLQNGNQQQQFGQTVQDVPWTMLQMLMGLTPKQTNSQTYGQKETESSASPLSMLGSLFGSGSGGILGGAKSLFGG